MKAVTKSENLRFLFLIYQRKWESKKLVIGFLFTIKLGKTISV